MDWADTLTPADQAFVKNFVLASGSLKEMARLYEVSYPTVRSKLNKIIEKIRLENIEGSYFEKHLRAYAINNDVPADLIDEIVDLYEQAREVE